MIAETGLAALWLAAAMALLQLVGGLTLIRGEGRLTPVIKPAALIQGALCVVSFASLMWLFYITDLSPFMVAPCSCKLKNERLVDMAVTGN